MTTHHTRYGDLEVQKIDDFAYTVSADKLQLNGKLYELSRTIVSVDEDGWHVSTATHLRRLDSTRRPTRRTTDKADRIALDAALTAASAAGITQQQVDALMWEHRLHSARVQQTHIEQVLEHRAEAVRVAECHVLAHQLPGAAGEIARALTADGWARSAGDLQEAVTGLLS